MALQLLAAIAVPFYFRRITHEEGVLRTVVAPIAATVLLSIAIVLVCTHLDLFTGASSLVNMILMAVAPAVFVLGIALARRLRRTRPDVYERFAAEPSADA
jgi:amino acid transporter